MGPKPSPESVSEERGPTRPPAGNPAPIHCPVSGVAKDPEGAGRGKTRLLVSIPVQQRFPPACHAHLVGSRPMIGPDGGHVAVTREEETTKVLNPARGSLPPTREQGGRGWQSGSRETPVSTSVPSRGQTLVPWPQAREGRGPPVTRHSPCKASLALASSCSFWTSWTLSSVAERTSEDLPPCDSSKSFVNISFICRRRWTSSWSRDTSSRRSARGEGHRVRARGQWLRLAHFFWGQFKGALASPICSAFGSFFYTCIKRTPTPQRHHLFQRGPHPVLGPP